jgi:hypothetical protein
VDILANLTTPGACNPDPGLIHMCYRASHPVAVKTAPCDSQVFAIAYLCFNVIFLCGVCGCFYFLNSKDAKRREAEMVPIMQRPVGPIQF